MLAKLFVKKGSLKVQNNFNRTSGSKFFPLARLFTSTKNMGKILSASSSLVIYKFLRFSKAWDESIAVTRKCLLFENVVDGIILTFRKLISCKIFKTEKRLIYQIKGFKILFPIICNTNKINYN